MVFIMHSSFCPFVVLCFSDNLLCSTLKRRLKTYSAQNKATVDNTMIDYHTYWDVIETEQFTAIREEAFKIFPHTKIATVSHFRLVL